MFEPPNRQINEERNLEWLVQSAGSQKTRGMLTEALIKALELNGTLHLQRDRSKVLLVVDGDKRISRRIPDEIVQPLIARVKIMANLDERVTTTRQQGTFDLSLEHNDVKVILVVQPMLLGEEFSLELERTPSSSRSEESY